MTSHRKKIARFVHGGRAVLEESPALFKNLKSLLKTPCAEASAPCRIDLGGTLDITTFHYPLRHLSPCTFNMAIDLRTRVSISSYDEGMIRVSSRGFQSAAFPVGLAPYHHPLGLIFAIAACFGVGGIGIDIESASPPRSALGGSSSAAVALVALLARLFEENGQAPASGDRIALLAQAIEASVAGVPCGLQDQLAAVFGGVHVWHWLGGINEPAFREETVASENLFSDIEQRVIVAYCGHPHESQDINSKWVKQFLSGKFRDIWEDIVRLTSRFVDAFQRKAFAEAAEYMNLETVFRQRMTPDVLDDVGQRLFDAAASHGCGARFTGAGGGGCMWALGRQRSIQTLRGVWRSLLKEIPEAGLLDAKIAAEGVQVRVR